jgi:hypothetical protein
MGNPCNKVDMSLFYAATTIFIGNGEIAPFWDLSWLGGEKPKDIAPLIYEASKKKKCTWRKPCTIKVGWLTLIWKPT